MPYDDLDRRHQSALEANTGSVGSKAVKNHARYDSMFLGANNLLPLDKKFKHIPHSKYEMAKVGATLVEKDLFPFTVVVPVLGMMINRYADIRPEAQDSIAAAQVKMKHDFKAANNQLPEVERESPAPKTPTDQTAMSLVKKFLTVSRVDIFEKNSAMAAALLVVKAREPRIAHQHALAVQIAQRQAKKEAAHTPA